MPAFNRIANKFAYSGMDVHHPPDLLPEGRCPLLFNLQPDLLSGALTTRPPIIPLAATTSGDPVHSLGRMNDATPGASPPFARFAGAGPNLFNGPGGALNLLDSGFSGNPLAMVPYRPIQSSSPWMYVYDKLRQQRYKTDSTTKQNIGIAAPTTAPEVARIRPLYKVIDNTKSVSTWGPGSTVGAPPPPALLDDRLRGGTTVGTILYDSGSSGMACIAPLNSALSYAGLDAGCMFSIGSSLPSAEDMVVEQVFPGTYSTSVLAIQYDSGTTGLCTIVPAIPLPGLQRNMLVKLNTTTNARVLSVTAGPDASYSFRCSTGGDTITVGQAIDAPFSFRAWTVGTYSAGQPIYSFCITFEFVPTLGYGTTNLGQVFDLLGTHPWTTPQNLSFAGPRPLQNSDYMHLSLAFINPQNVREIHIQIAMKGDPTGPENFLYYVVRPGDFQTSVTSGLTAQATLQAQLGALSSQISSAGVAEGTGETIPQPPYPAPELISNSQPVTSQLAVGDLAWTEVMFKLGDMTRSGSNPSVTLADANNLGIYVFIDGSPTQHTKILFGGWWVGGGYGPDCNFNSFGNQAPEIQWRYRYRNSLTGARSTVSPETRNGEILRRQAVSLTAPDSPDPQVDMIDWERRGGTNPDWHYVLSVPQSGMGTTTTTDNITEGAAQIGDALEVACYQPWPVTDTPKTGTALVTGTRVVWQSGDIFNTRWIRGTEIIIAGNTYTLYAPPESTTVFDLAQNVVPPPGVYDFKIPEATIEGQPMYGAWLDEANNRVCAVGDPLNPGFMYFSLNDNPDGASDAGYIEITSPSEPLLNGLYMEGANYVFTSSSLYRVESTPGAVNPYAAYRLSGVEGLAGPWAFDAQRKIVFYWGPDGIYAYSFGQAAENLTADPLFPLFPHEGQPGRQAIPGVPVSIAGQTIYPPSYGLDKQLRIGYSESFVYATYQNSAGTTEALVYSLKQKGWRKDTYSPTASLFALEKGVPNPKLMVGGTDGSVYSVAQSGFFDAAGAISWTVLAPVRDAGDSRSIKQWGDMMLDYSGDPFNCAVLWDNLLVAGVSAAVPIHAQRDRTLFNLFTPPDTDDTPLIHYNMSVMLTGSGCPIYLYEWQPSFLPLPELTTSRVTDWQTGGALHYKYVQGIRIHANTFGVNKVVRVQFDGYQNGPLITINHQGEQTLGYSFATPFKCHMMRLVPVDDVPWDLFPDSEWIAEPEPEPANYWISQPTALGQQGFLHCREMWLPYCVPGSGAVISVVVDGGTPVTLATLGAAASPVKDYFVTPPLKGKYWQLTASGTGLQIYENDLEFLVKSWGSTGPYQRVRPFGDVSGGAGRSGARI